MKRKGLVKDVTSLIIVAVGISLLVLGGITLYFKAKSNAEEELAKGALNTLEERVNALKEGEQYSLPLQGPEGWAIYAWNEEPRPQQCLDKNCVCVGKQTFSGEPGEVERNKQIENSQQGICRQFESYKIILKYRLLRNGVESIEEFNSLSFPSNLMDVRISKMGKEITILHYTNSNLPSNDVLPAGSLPIGG